MILPCIIAIEGIDGTGKSGVVNSLQTQFSGLRWTFSREPSDSGYRELIKQSINFGDEILLALLFAADHRHHIERVITPALYSNHVVITDRYLHSHLAYQTTTLTGVLSNPEAWLANIYSPEWTILPDLVIHLTADPTTCETRIRKSRTQIDNYEKAEFLAKIEQNYQKFYKDPRYHSKVVQINTEDMTETQVYFEVLTELTKRSV